MLHLYGRRCIKRGICLLSRFNSLSAAVHIGEDWETVIGLEIHAQILSKSKLFSGAQNCYTQPVNTLVSEFDCALPGTLPIVNKRCITAAVQAALSFGCSINTVSHFDRKHYFYADLPAGYQITQQVKPIAEGGCIEFVFYDPVYSPVPENRTLRLERIQIEQDSGKSIHDEQNRCSLIDLNRAGVGLIEIVTAPGLRNAAEVGCCIREIQRILRTVGVCSGNMSEGALRVDASISVRRPGDPLGVRTEIKNLNSVRHVMKALKYEANRQISLLENGQEVVNETLSFDVTSGTTSKLRDKESIHDYRFMPEPNLPPLRLRESETGDKKLVSIAALKKSLPRLPSYERQLLLEHNLSLYMANVIVSEDGAIELFENALDLCNSSSVKRSATYSLSNIASVVAKLIVYEVMCLANSKKVTVGELSISPSHLADISILLLEGLVNYRVAQKLVSSIFSERSPIALVEENGWVLEKNPTVVKQLVKDFLDTLPNELVEKSVAGKKKSLSRLNRLVFDSLGYKTTSRILDITLRELLNEQS